MIFFDENPYTFDTGANTTLLYRPYFLENHKMIEQNYQLSEIDFGGAGGNDKQKGYRIKKEFEISGKKTNLDNVFLLINKSEKKGNIYGKPKVNPVYFIPVAEGTVPGFFQQNRLPDRRHQNLWLSPTAGPAVLIAPELL